MSLVIVGAALTWFFLMGGKDFLWDLIKAAFGDELIKSVVPEEDQLKVDWVNKFPKEENRNERLQEIVANRKSEPIVKRSMLELENEERVPMNAFLGRVPSLQRRIQPRI
jgi:hypothetical protein